jgi:hypothetical protein
MSQYVNVEVFKFSSGEAAAYLKDNEDDYVHLCTADSGREVALMAANRLRKLATRFEQLAQLPEEAVLKESVQDDINQWQKLK